MLVAASLRFLIVIWTKTAVAPTISGSVGNFPFDRTSPGRGIEAEENINTTHLSSENRPVSHLRYYSNYLTPGGNICDAYLTPLVIYTRGLLFNFIMLIPVLLFAASVLTAIYNIPEYQFRGHYLFLNIKELAFYLNEKEEFENSYRSIILKETQTLEDYSYDERESIVHQRTDEASRQAKDLNTEIERDKINIIDRLRALIILPTAFLLFMLMAGFLFFFILQLDQAGSFLRRKGRLPIRLPLISRFFTKNSELKNRRLFNRSFSFVLAACMIFFLVELFGAAIVYWSHLNIPNRVVLLSILILLGPQLIKSHNIVLLRSNRWISIIGSSILYILTPLLLLYLTGMTVNILRGEFLLLCGPFTWDNLIWLNLFYGLVVSVLFFLFNSYFLNINKISLHNFYRDRLTRAYILKGEKTENENPFHSINLMDEVKLSTLYDKSHTVGPYHIINANLNLKKKLPETDEGIFRRGESFIFSKHWCGSQKTGYCKTSHYETLDVHLDLGTAMAISGAAFSTGMGEEDKPSLRMLMGMLNIRLGYWAPTPNPNNRKKTIWQGPFIPSSHCALRELLGLYTPNYRFINLSDGGHFDNIGAYEMLKRRCKYIVVADAEADPELKFQALSYLIRLARIDFGIEIKIDISGLIHRDHHHFSPQHCAVGTIRYPNKNGDDEFGYLLYCKSTLSGDEPAHLYEYHVKNPDFPHETTANQWFDEQQFEAYRELGYHIAKNVFNSVPPLTLQSNMESLFIRLKEFWHPSTVSDKEKFTHHANELNRIFEQIKTNPDLHFMDAQIYPEWGNLMRCRDSQEKENQFQGLLPEKSSERRAGFYTCSQMIQLMENVYLDLDLEKNHNHPDNRGWMNLFANWSRSNMFRIAWAISACTFGAKFHNFCEKHLHLDNGDVQVQMVPLNDNKLENLHEGKYSRYLTPFERKIISDFCRINKCPSELLSLFLLSVENKTFSDEKIEFCFGFALMRKTKKYRGVIIDYFRVQDHLRRMRLGRLAMENSLVQLLNEYASSCTKPPSPAQLMLFLNGIRINSDINQDFIDRHHCNIKAANHILASVSSELCGSLDTFIEDWKITAPQFESKI